jgi:beta-lactamase regulating signal transducer with metallopeptidase domain/protocatechuate 3,4-dioxygenase beta subunit
MINPLDRFIHWLADLHVLSSLLLLAGLMIVHRLKQPALRMAISRSIVVGLATLAVVVAAPGWPRSGLPRWIEDDVAPTPNLARPSVEHETRELAARTVERPIGPTTPVVEIVASRGATPVSEPKVTFPGWRSIFLAGYAIGVTLNLAWIALGAHQAARLRRSVRVADSRVRILMAKLSGDARATTRICLSTRIGLPVAIGVVRPMIVLPGSFAERETDEGIEAALAHELSHIQNGDLRWLAVLRLLTMVFFAQPLFWLLRRTIHADQEALADAAASTLHGDGRLAYAETLVGWARSSNGVKPGALASAALALWERPSLLKRRVSVLLDPDIHIELRISHGWRLAATCVGLILALGLSLFTVQPTAVTAQVMKAQSSEKNAPGAKRSEAEETGVRFEYAGRVVDPDGKPTAGAKLHLAYFRYQGKGAPPVRATSDAQGRFHFEVTKQDFSDTDIDDPWTTAVVVASLEGFGLGWADAGESEEKPIDRGNLTLRLVRDDLPVSGRIVNLQGQPVAGVLIQLNEIMEPEQGDLSSWISAVKGSKGEPYHTEAVNLTRKLWLRGSGLPNPVTTDRAGRFSIHGIGRERLIRLKLSGLTIQTKEISVLTRASEPFPVNLGRGSTDWGVILYYGARFTHVASPTKPLVGVVTDKDTGRPLAGVRIECDKTAEYPVYGMTGIETTTGQDGRYRLVGLPKGRGNRVIAIPAKGQPYLASALEIPDSPGLDDVRFDIALKRGIVIEGRVTDKVTGKPLKAYVEYDAYRDNPDLLEAPGFSDAQVWGQYKTEQDGSFQVVGLPGHGLLSALFIGGGDKYLKGVGLPRDESPGDTYKVVPNPGQDNWNVFAELDLRNDSPTVRRNLVMEPGVTRTIRVVDPDGKPLAGAGIRLQPRVTNFTAPQPKADFDLEALRPGEIRVLDAIHDGRKLAGSVEVHADGQGIVIFQLLPWGTVIGKLVDEDGRPRAKIDLALDKGVQDPVVTDSQGQFRVERIVPGRSNQIKVRSKPYYVTGRIPRAIVLVPGEVKDLGEVRELKDEE